MTKAHSSQTTTPLTVRIPERLMAHLRKRSEELECSLSDAGVDAFRDQFDWYKLNDELVEKLRADAKKSGKGGQREYVMSLLMKRYQELVVEAHQDGQEPKASGKR
jgi:hypothetical protein